MVLRCCCYVIGSRGRHCAEVPQHLFVIKDKGFLAEPAKVG